MTPEDAAAAGRGAAGLGVGVDALTRVGVRGGGTAVVDRAGRLQLGSRVIDWWIGADDRWHRPGAEVAVRQQRLQAAPVVETRLRLPGGDALQRVYGARRRGSGEPGGPGGPGGPGRGGDHVVVEVVNESRLPVALALTVGPGVAIAQEGAVTQMGGASVLLAPRPPSRVAEASSEAALFDAVAGGRADEFDQVRHYDDPSGAFLALVWPLAHGATLRMAAPLGGSGPGAGAGFDAASSRPLELPTAEQVARGWHRQLEADVRIDLPDPGLAEAVLAARSELLLGGDGETAGNAHVDLQLVRAGARWGDEEVVAAATARLAAAAGEARRSDPSDQVEHHAALLGALAEARRLGTAPPATAAGDGDEWCLSVVASAVARLDRALRRPGRQGTAQLERYRAALADAAELLRRSGQVEAADHVGRLHRRPGAVRADAAAEAAADAAAARTFLEAALARASPTWTWADPGTGPEVLLAARRLLLDDRPPDGVALLPGWPARWWGAPVSFHRLPARWGRVSAALRWHGDRPALLWEIDRSARPDLPDVSELVPTVRAPALDPAWGATGWRGEALLAPVPPPPRKGDGAADRAGDGSFR